MDADFGRLDLLMAGAYVRGAAVRGKVSGISAEILEKPLEMLSQKELGLLVNMGKEAGLKIHYFKSMEQLPRVRMALGFLMGIGVSSLLDVGSGRGAFLFPFLRMFPGVPVTSVDLLERRVEVLQDLSTGGFECLRACRADLLNFEAPAHSFDAVTLLEVLEHIPDAFSAVQAAVRLAGRYVVVTVPSKPDDNPEHIHLFTKDTLTEMFMDAGARKLRFDGVSGHLFMTASV